MEHTGFSKDAIAKYVTGAVPLVSPDNKVGTVHKDIFEGVRDYETINYVYVVKGKKLVGVMSIKELANAKDSAKIGDVMRTELTTVRARTHRERAVLKALEHSLKAIPVIDKKGNFLGVVPSDSLLEILHQEANEDLFYIAGSGKPVVKEPVISQVSVRLPWILVGLFGGIITSTVITQFESTLLEMVRLAAFIPVILNISGNVATQSAVLFVRELTLGRITGIAKALVHEVLTGIVIGVASGVLLGLVAVIGHSSPTLGLIVGVSIVITQTFAAILGLLVPWIFKVTGKDPALGTGPVVTTLMDIVATTVYLTVAWGMLRVV